MSDAPLQDCAKGCGKTYRDRSNRKAGCPRCRLGRNNCPTAGCTNLKLKKSKVCRHCNGGGLPGEASYGWKGGRIKQNKGYIMLHTPEHPRSKRNSGYVFEHHLVMEKELGRFLLAFENVHHKNGIKHDNTVTNLELWCKPQPPGQRVEDLVSWVVTNYPELVRESLLRS